ncbi:MAG: transporter substrate-binding domain-containing protein [Acidimicrobiia bacterium]|nr:transporter substrate-binding domain-containing protein [Acidimicrobiia bacterium]
MKRLRTIVLLVAALALVAAACGGDDGGGEYSLVADGKLTVCTDAPYPPMEIIDDDGNFTGFDIEIMRAIAGELDLDLEVLNAGFDSITSGLAMEAGDCDIAAASITITAAREENIDFSDAYFVADQSLLVKKDSGLTGLADLSGLKIAVQTGTTGEMYANENNPGAEIVSFENPGDLFTALNAGQADAVLQDIVPNAAQALDDDTVEVVETYPTQEEYGFAVQEEGKEALLEAVNEALQKLRDDGDYDDIYDDWF